MKNKVIKYKETIINAIKTCVLKKKDFLIRDNEEREKRQYEIYKELKQKESDLQGKHWQLLPSCLIDDEELKEVQEKLKEIECHNLMNKYKNECIKKSAY